MENQNGYEFDFERLVVYRKSLEFVKSVFRITRELPREYQYSIADQLRRAALSIVNNLAEGSGKLSKKEKAQFYRVSLNSTRECVPMLTVLSQEKQIAAPVHQQLRGDVVYVANMLGKLIGSLNI